MNKCSVIKSDNTQCKANPIRGSEFCFRHGSSTIEQKLASSKGGQNRALQGSWGQAVKLSTPADIKLFLGKVINGVWTGQVPVPVGTSMGFLARCWLDAHEAADTQNRMDALEKRLDSLNNEHK